QERQREQHAVPVADCPGPDAPGLPLHGHHQPGGEVGDEPEAADHRRYDEGDADEGRVDPEPLGHPAGHPTEEPVVAGPPPLAVAEPLGRPREPGSVAAVMPPAVGRRRLRGWRRRWRPGGRIDGRSDVALVDTPNDRAAASGQAIRGDPERGRGRSGSVPGGPRFPLPAGWRTIAPWNPPLPSGSATCSVAPSTGE